MQNIVSAPAAIENPITEEVRKHIEAVATGMIGHANLRMEDFPDICQELSLRVIKAAPLFSPESGSYYTFAQAVIRRHRDRIFRYRMRRGIDCPHIPMDSVLRENEDSVSQLDRISFARSQEDESTALVVEEVRNVLKRLPDRLTRVCEMLMDGYDRDEIQRVLAISPRTYYRRLSEIRSKFKKSRFFSKMVAQKWGVRERN